MSKDALFKSKTSMCLHGVRDGETWEKNFPALSVKNVDVEKRQIRVLASTDDLDRHGDRVLPSAFKKRLNTFKRNPVILAAHMHRSGDATPTVVGKAVEVWIDKAGLWAVIQFARTPLAEQYWTLYEGGFMKAVSIGFRIIEQESRVENGKSVYVITEAELYEISLVAVPANPSAVVKGKDRKKFFVATKKIEKIEAEKDKNRALDFAKAFLGDEILVGNNDDIDVEIKSTGRVNYGNRVDFGRFFK